MSLRPSSAGTPLRLLATLFLGCLLAGESSLAGASDEQSAGGEIYRLGLRPSGEPVTALVAGDVPILGTQFSCQSCHGRSGMGSIEGAYIVPPISAQFLFVESAQPKRPAYDTESLARVLRSGVTPSGRTLDPLMPRYLFSDAEVASLANYLHTLSPGNSPGVDDKVIHFATVFTNDIPTDERDAVLAVLKTFAAEKNRKTRLNDQRLDRGYTPSSKLPTVFREWQLDEWVLTGPSEGWSEQLEAYYKDTPVFALVGGLSHDAWGPIGNFCEGHEVPCLLPSTDLPQADKGDFYTLYFSEGLGLEANLIANHLATQEEDKVIQVYCSDLAAQAANVLRSVLIPTGTKVENLRFDCGHAPPPELETKIAASPGIVAVLWLNQSQLTQVVKTISPTKLYLSSTLLNRDLAALPIQASVQAFLAHPFRLPGRRDSAMGRFKVWAKSRHIQITHPRHQAEAFFACLTINDAMKHVGRFFVRDFVLDVLDHAQGLIAYLPVYPQPSLGPGQRFLSKGGYIVPLKEGQPQIEAAHWIVP